MRTFSHSPGMPSMKYCICWITIFLFSFSTVCLSLPHSQSRRSIVKDYFVDPLGIPTVEFRRGEDGKYHMVNPHKMGSEVKYAAAESLDEDEGIEKLEGKGGVKPHGKDLPINTEILKEETFTDKLVPKLTVDAALKTDESKVIDEKVLDVSKTTATTKKLQEAIDLKVTEEAAMPFLPPRSKAIEKPNGKDELPIMPEEKTKSVEENRKKISIGQLPILYPGNDSPYGAPVLVPVRGMSYGRVTFMPVPPPTMDISDRLPMADVEAEVDESEASVVEEAIPKAEKSEASYHLRNPLALVMQFPSMPIYAMLKEAENRNNPQQELKAEIKEILGRKFLLKTNLMKYPIDGNNRVYVRLMSVRPLDKYDSTLDDVSEMENEEEFKFEIEDDEEPELMPDSEKWRELVKSQSKDVEKSKEEVSKKEEVNKKKEEAIVKDGFLPSKKELEVLKAEETWNKEKMANSDVNMLSKFPAEEKPKADETEFEEKIGHEKTMIKKIADAEDTLIKKNENGDKAVMLEEKLVKMNPALEMKYKDGAADLEQSKVVFGNSEIKMHDDDASEAEKEKAISMDKTLRVKIEVFPSELDKKGLAIEGKDGVMSIEPMKINHEKGIKMLGKDENGMFLMESGMKLKEEAASKDSMEDEMMMVDSVIKIDDKEKVDLESSEIMDKDHSIIIENKSLEEGMPFFEQKPKNLKGEIESKASKSKLLKKKKKCKCEDTDSDSEEN